MNGFKISVVMPAYNTEKYIGEAIESVQQQTHQDWELIIVDDGSADGTSDVVKEYADKDRRIVYFRQKNAGQSAARNTALDRATGKFVLFLDSDDMFIGKAVFAECIRLMNEGCEMVAFNAAWLPNPALIKGKVRPVDRQDPKKVNKSRYCLLPPIYPIDTMKIKVPESKYGASFSNVCFGCFRRDIIEQNRLRFLEGLIFEDWAFMVEYSTHCQAINYVNLPYYLYRDNPTSSTKSMGTKVFDVFAVYESLHQKLAARDLWKDYQEITTLKIMFSLPIFYANMRDTIADENILNDYIARAHQLLKAMPEELYAKNLLLSGHADFLVPVHDGSVKTYVELDQKRNRYKQVRFILSIPLISLGLRLIPNKLKRGARHLLVNRM